MCEKIEPTDNPTIDGAEEFAMAADATRDSMQDDEILYKIEDQDNGYRIVLKYVKIDNNHYLSGDIEFGNAWQKAATWGLLLPDGILLLFDFIDQSIVFLKDGKEISTDIKSYKTANGYAFTGIPLENKPDFRRIRLKVQPLQTGTAGWAPKP